MPTPLDHLVDALRALPGVGQRSAQRMAYHLLQHDRTGARVLAHALTNAVEQLTHCATCHVLTDRPVCLVCSDPERDLGLLCVVESAADQAALERTGGYHGRYFVLQGRLKPLEGLGPEAVGFEALLRRVEQDSLREVILALSFTAEGEATAQALQALLGTRTSVPVTRLSRGVPVGSELEYVDASTIAHALAHRR